MADWKARLMGNRMSAQQQLAGALGGYPTGQPEMPWLEPRAFTPPPQFTIPQYAPMMDYSQPTDIYTRGGMDNQLIDRYNQLAQALQAQQSAMVNRPAASYPAQPVKYAPTRPNPYVNFASLFGGR